MSKVIAILEAITDVMVEVEKAELPLDMEYYYKDKLKGDTIHTCGTAACIIGYAALDEKVQSLIGMHYNRKASRIPDKLINFLEPVIGYSKAWSLVWCLFDTDDEVRRDEAKQVPELSHLLHLPHFNKEPTPTEAIEALVAVTEVIRKEFV
jgi:hypothetical protein